MFNKISTAEDWVISFSTGLRFQQFQNIPYEQQFQLLHPAL